MVLQIHLEGMSPQQTSAACTGDANLARRLSAVLSLPVVESTSQVDGSRAVSSFWPPKPFTESGLHLMPYQCTALCTYCSCCCCSIMHGVRAVVYWLCCFGINADAHVDIQSLKGLQAELIMISGKLHRR